MRGVAVAVAALAALAGCGGRESPAPRTPAPPPAGTIRTPAALTAACTRARVACPAVWPPRLDGRALPRRSVTVFRDGPGVALVDVANGFCRRRCRGVFHAIVGQQARRVPPVAEGLRFPMRDVVIPVRGGGRFVQQRAPRRLAVVRVGGARATVYAAAPYPQGGLHGGHVAVLWNAGGHGHIVSLHAVGMRRREVAALAIALARSVSATPSARRTTGSACTATR